MMDTEAAISMSGDRSVAEAGPITINAPKAPKKTPVAAPMPPATGPTVQDIMSRHGASQRRHAQDVLHGNGTLPPQPVTGEPATSKSSASGGTASETTIDALLEGRLAHRLEQTGRIEGASEAVELSPREKLFASVNKAFKGLEEEAEGVLSESLSEKDAKLLLKKLMNQHRVATRARRALRIVNTAAIESSNSEGARRRSVKAADQELREYFDGLRSYGGASGIIEAAQINFDPEDPRYQRLERDRKYVEKNTLTDQERVLLQTMGHRDPQKREELLRFLEVSRYKTRAGAKGIRDTFTLDFNPQFDLEHGVPKRARFSHTSSMPTAELVDYFERHTSQETREAILHIKRASRHIPVAPERRALLVEQKALQLKEDFGGALTDETARYMADAMLNDEELVVPKLPGKKRAPRAKPAVVDEPPAEEEAPKEEKLLALPMGELPKVPEPITKRVPDKFPPKARGPKLHAREPLRGRAKLEEATLAATRDALVRIATEGGRGSEGARIIAERMRNREPIAAVLTPRGEEARVPLVEPKKDPEVESRRKRVAERLKRWALKVPAEVGFLPPLILGFHLGHTQPKPSESFPRPVVSVSATQRPSEAPGTPQVVVESTPKPTETPSETRTPSPTVIAEATLPPPPATTEPSSQATPQTEATTVNTSQTGGGDSIRPRPESRTPEPGEKIIANGQYVRISKDGSYVSLEMNQGKMMDGETFNEVVYQNSKRLAALLLANYPTYYAGWQEAVARGDQPKSILVSEEDIINMAESDSLAELQHQADIVQTDTDEMEQVYLIPKTGPADNMGKYWDETWKQVNEAFNTKTENGGTELDVLQDAILEGGAEWKKEHEV